MLDNLFRDETTMPLVQEWFAVLRSYFEAARDTLMAGRKVRATIREPTRAALGNATAFSTWKSLVREQGLTDTDATELISAVVTAAN
jgi:hypothetical protein